MIDCLTFLDRFRDFYDYLYENPDVERALYSYVDEFDYQMRNSEAFRSFVCNIIKARGDIFSSDRETIAFMMVFKSMKEDKAGK